MTTQNLVMPIKQGEVLNQEFTITQENDAGTYDPKDLTNYTIKFLVKKSPLEQSEAIVDKEITLTSDIETVGYISDAVNGKFIVRITKEDSSFPVMDYALIIFLVGNNEEVIISSTCYASGIYRICKQ